MVGPCSAERSKSDLRAPLALLRLRQSPRTECSGSRGLCKADARDLSLLRSGYALCPWVPSSLSGAVAAPAPWSFRPEGSSFSGGTSAQPRRYQSQEHGDSCSDGLPSTFTPFQACLRFLTLQSPQIVSVFVFVV